MVQTRRLAAYESALERLQARELVYPCTCTRSDIDRAASAPHAEHEGPVYPGTCAGRTAADAARLGGRPYCWRFRVPESSPAFDDAFRGPTAVDLRSAGGDFVVWKSAGTPAYQLAVVVDDAAQGITDVVRGADLLDSTPRQIYLQQLLGLPTPRYLHVPVALDTAGGKLSKQTAAAPIETDPCALRRALAFLGQSEAGTLDQALRGWDPQLILRRRAMALAP